MSVRGHSKTDRLIMYDRIHRYRKEDHRSVNWIAKQLQLNRRTVKRYLAMTQAEYERHLEASGERPLLLEPYTQFVVVRLNRFPDTKAAQMHDWLKEHYPEFPDVCQGPFHGHAAMLQPLQVRVVQRQAVRQRNPPPRYMRRLAMVADIDFMLADILYGTEKKRQFQKQNKTIDRQFAAIDLICKELTRCLP